VVDDVVTTAATARELAQILKRAGAAEVQVWAVARTIV
jgi:predicted amidophosphoribosyltransferase